jgi:hypothetical protein
MNEEYLVSACHQHGGKIMNERLTFDDINIGDVVETASMNSLTVDYANGNLRSVNHDEGMLCTVVRKHSSLVDVQLEDGGIAEACSPSRFRRATVVPTNKEYPTDMLTWAPKRR